MTEGKGKEYVAVYNGKTAATRTEGGGIIGDGEEVLDHWRYYENSEKFHAQSDDEAVKIAVGKTSENKHLIRLSRLEDIALIGKGK